MRQVCKGTFRILVVNPGSTSTKIALYAGKDKMSSKSIPFKQRQQLDLMADAEQLTGLVLEYVRAQWNQLDAVACRGGLLRPLQGGVYAVNERMVAELAAQKYGEHACNIGAIIGSRLAATYACQAFIVNPVIVDEMSEVSKISGHPRIQRRSIFHALNQKQSALDIAERLGKRYEECNFIVAHIGGGISVGAHERGRVVDVNNALEGDGPFTPERAGSLASFDLLKLGGQFADTKQFQQFLITKCGLRAHCGTNNLKAVISRI